jgi:hypothetical protein
MWQLILLIRTSSVGLSEAAYKHIKRPAQRATRPALTCRESSHGSSKDAQSTAGSSHRYPERLGEFLGRIVRYYSSKGPGHLTVKPTPYSLERADDVIVAAQS